MEDRAADTANAFRIWAKSSDGISTLVSPSQHSLQKKVLIRSTPAALPHSWVLLVFISCRAVLYVEAFSCHCLPPITQLARRSCYPRNNPVSSHTFYCLNPNNSPRVSQALWKMDLMMIVGGRCCPCMHFKRIFCRSCEWFRRWREIQRSRVICDRSLIAAKVGRKRILKDGRSLVSLKSEALTLSGLQTEPEMSSLVALWVYLLTVNFIIS